MFSRRHPYLYFFLVLSVVVTAAIIIMSILLAVCFRDSDFVGFNEMVGEKVGIIEVTGVIADSEDAIRALKSFREDDSVKAIVLRINSPGGGVGPSQEIFREVRKTLPSKKIIASMGSIAASGGYYIAAGTDGIIANPGTITGSIGVIMGHTNFQEVLNKIGLVPVVVKSGIYKDMGSPLRKMTQDEKMILQDFVNKIHKQFVRDVAEGRNMNEAQMGVLADGRIFSGEEAKSLGLIDRLGNFEDAIEWAGRMGGIRGKISTVYARKKKFSFLKYLTGASIKEFVNRSFNSCLYADFLCVPPFNN